MSVDNRLWKETTAVVRVVLRRDASSGFCTPSSSLDQCRCPYPMVVSVLLSFQNALSAAGLTGLG